MPSHITQLMAILHVEWDKLHDHLKVIPWQDIFKLLYVYITHCKYQVKPLSSWFSAGCAAAIFHRNHFFVCTNIMNILNLKVKFSQASNYCKGFLKLPKLHVLMNLKSPSLPGNLALRTFYELLMLSKKVNLLYSLYSMAQRCCLLHLIKQNCQLKTFIRTLILMACISLHLLFLLELI